MSKLVTIQALSVETGVPVRTLRTLKAQRKLPYIKAGFRTHFFDPERVRAALEKFEVKGVA